MKERWGWWVCNALDTTTADDVNWCEELFGCPNSAGRWFYEFQSNKIYFKKKEDAIWFELRWTKSTISQK